MVMGASMRLQVLVKGRWKVMVGMDALFGNAVIVARFELLIKPHFIAFECFICRFSCLTKGSN